MQSEKETKEVAGAARLHSATKRLFTSIIFFSIATLVITDGLLAYCYASMLLCAISLCITQGGKITRSEMALRMGIDAPIKTRLKVNITLLWWPLVAAGLLMLLFPYMSALLSMDHRSEIFLIGGVFFCLLTAPVKWRRDTFRNISDEQEMTVWQSVKGSWQSLDQYMEDKSRNGKSIRIDLATVHDANLSELRWHIESVYHIRYSNKMLFTLAFVFFSTAWLIFKFLTFLMVYIELS